MRFGEYTLVERSKYRDKLFKKHMASKLWGKLGESVSTDLEAEFPGLDLDLYDTRAGYILSKIALPKEQRGFGIGTQVMQRLIDIADSEGKMIALTPDTAFGGSKGRLINFYKRFGFVANKGRNKTFDFRETMVRYPQQDINEALDSPYPITWEGDADSASAVAEVPLPDGDFDYLEIEFSREDQGFFEIVFTRNSRMKATGKGDEFKIFATVIEAIKQWWDKIDQDEVDEIYFSASKNPEDSARRHVLYSRFAKQFASQIGFDLKITDRNNNVGFKLSRKDVAEGNIVESFKLQLERDDDMDVLHILNTATGKRTEVRGKKDYEGNGYDPTDKLHQLLDTVGKAANISELMNGSVVTINPNHPQAKKAKAATTRAYNETLEEALSDISKSSQVFVDMDGVLADFFGSWKKLVGKDWREIDSKDIPAALQKIRDTKDFWLKIPPTPNASKLLGLIKKLKGSYNILSAPLPDDPNSEPHKREWIKKYLKAFPPSRVIITQDKEKYATQSDGTPNILIDDFGQNIAKWEAAGGVGFKHKDHKFERTVKSLKQNMTESPEVTMWTNPDWFGADVDADYWNKQPAKIIDIDKLTPYEPEAKMKDPESASKMKAIAKSIQAGEKIDPIVISKHEGKWLILDGHHRYFASKLAGVKRVRVVVVDPKYLTWRDDVPDDDYYTENFADGKRKGKSRPGRVKRAGASCKGSVADLRAKAKKYSGERGKMYHWCANMKSGRK